MTSQKGREIYRNKVNLKESVPLGGHIISLIKNSTTKPGKSHWTFN